MSSAGASVKLVMRSAAFGSVGDGGVVEFSCDGFGSGVGNVGIVGSPLHEVAGEADLVFVEKPATPEMLQSSFSAPIFFGIAVGTGWWVVVVGFWLSG